MIDAADDQEKPLTDGNASGWPILQRALVFYRSVGATYYGRRAEQLLAAPPERRSPLATGPDTLFL